MERKVIKVPSEVKGHFDYMLEGTKAEVLGCISEDYYYEPKYHANGNYDNITMIGEFSVDPSEEDSVSEQMISNRIIYGKKSLNYRIYVLAKEQLNVPHFHIVNPAIEIDVCICIYEPKYFDHASHTGTLNSRELKMLDAFLRTCHDPDKGETYWDYIDSCWYTSNILSKPNPAYYRAKYRLTSVQPNYRDIRLFRSEY